MNAPDTFRLNAYRVLRVSASASAFDIHKASMRRAAAPGFSGTSEVDIPGLGDVPRGDADICAAVARLRNPVQRITDRLFWFCRLPTPASAQRSSCTMDSTDHDAVLRDVINLSATQGGLDESRLAAWVEALRAWHALTCDDDYWFLTSIYEDQGGFETPATPEEIEALRADAVRIAAGPLTLAACAACEAGEQDTVRRIVIALAKLRHTGPWASAAINEIQEIAPIDAPATPQTDRRGPSWAAKVPWPTLGQPGRIM